MRTQTMLFAPSFLFSVFRPWIAYHCCALSSLVTCALFCSGVLIYRVIFGSGVSSKRTSIVCTTFYELAWCSPSISLTHYGVGLRASACGVCECHQR